MTSHSARRPTPKESQALKLASVDEHGYLPSDTAPGYIAAMLEARWIYGQDTDGYRLDPDSALREISTALFRILPSGRRALLRPAQWRALTDALNSSGRLSDRVTAPTIRCLAALRLVEYRSSEGEISADPSCSGFYPHRSELGDQVADITVVGDS
ncbi:hypothetical protein ACFVQ9_34695 [Streptomyces goshikiensis]|uniref:hypothetical protein n=1 Tax=Streptomyces goshikiensis TaxID=1942 RepID=UPI0036AB4ECA